MNTTVKLKSISFILFLLVGIGFLPAQERIQVKGKIVDTGKEEIIGANVLIKGTTIGTITDFDGNFTLTADVGSVLVVAYLGYLPTEVEVKGTAPMLIELTENSKELDELVVGIRYPEENYQYRFPIGDQSNF